MNRKRFNYFYEDHPSQDFQKERYSVFSYFFRWKHHVIFLKNREQIFFLQVRGDREFTKGVLVDVRTEREEFFFRKGRKKGLPKQEK